MDGIFLSTWRIFGLHGKNIFQRFYVVNKYSIHHSRSCVHMVVALIDKFDTNPILININKLKPYKFIEDKNFTTFIN